MSRQMRGLGRVFKRKGSRFFWLEYFHAGRRFRESSESESEQVATKLLKRRLAETGQGKVVDPAEERVRFEDLADAVLNEYRLKGYRSLEAAEIHIRKLRTFFGDKQVTTSHLGRFVCEPRTRRTRKLADHWCLPESFSTSSPGRYATVASIASLFFTTMASR